MTLSRPPANSFRHAAFVLAALVLVVLSCGPELTAPRGGASRVARGISFSPVFPAVLSQVASDASGIVDFNRVHIVLRHGDGTVALDTVVNYPAGADSLLVSLDVSLALGTPDTGEPLAMTLGYINAAGDTVFKGGPVTVNAVPALPGAPPPPPVSIPVAYTGPGASATSVVISPRSTTVFAGDPFSFTAVAKDVNGNVLAGTPIVWASLNPAVATIASPVAGNGVAQNVRGSAQITAQLLTGPSDAVSVSVLLRASTIAAVSGASQAAVVNSALPQPLVVRVTASDGVGVAGVAVTFAAGTGGGTVGTANATTDAGGLAQTTFTLGATPGTQTVTATATGLSGSPVTFAETANAPPATQLVFTTQPANGTAGVVLANVVVTAKDAGGATATSFTGAVTLAFGSTPGGVTLGGTTTVNAVAGVATFSTLNITRAAAGYTLVALANGVTSTTSSTFAIAAAAASSIVADSGGAQAGLAGALLGQPFVVRVLDAFSNPVPNVTVTWAVTAGGGSLTATTSTTDVNGRARVTLTLGATGANTVSASVGGAGTVSFTATAVSAGPTQLVFVTQPSNVTAGIPIAASPVVQARDASNNPVPSFTGNVTITIGTNPGGATLGGTVTVAAAAGNATLANLRLNKIGAGYTLVASAAGLTSATSGTFNVTAAPAIAIAADSGAGQVGTTGSALAQQLVARVTDSLGNPVSGTPVAWSVLSGGGVLGGATTSTDVNGRVRAAWTLGGVVGAQSAQVASVGLAGSPVAFGATGLIPGANKQWTGATSNAWNVATNWLPNGVPVATDSVVIVPITNQAVVSTAVAVKHLLVQAGAILTNNGSITTTGNLTIVAAGTIQNAGGSITVGGNLDATGGIIGGAGTVTLSGAANRTVLGAISATSTTISGPGLTTLASQLIVSGDLTIDTGTDVDLNGQILVVGAGNVLTATGGTLTLTNIASTLNVQTGNLTFQGGSEAGKLTSGTINFAGPALNASVTPFTAGPGLTFNFSGGGAQTFTGTPTFGTMFVVNVAGVTGPAFTTGAMTFSSGSVVSSGVATITGQLTDVVGNRLSATSIVFTGPTPVSATTPSIASPVTFNGPATLAGNLAVNGSITVTAGALTLGGHVLSTTTDFSTVGTGQLNMTFANDSLKVAGNATFAGSPTTGFLTAGNLVVGGNFAATGTAFDAVPPHTTTFNGAGTQTLGFAAPVAGRGFGHVIFRGAGLKGFSGNQTIVGNVIVGATFSSVVNGAFTITVGGTSISDSTVAGGKWQPAATVFSGTPSDFAATLSSNVTFQGGTAVLNRNVTFGNVTIDGAGARLKLNGHILVGPNGGTFTTQNGGTLDMTTVGDSLSFTGGTATFNGGSEVALLTKGSLVTGALIQSGPSATSYEADSTHKTWLSSGAGGTINFANPGTGSTASHFGTLIDEMGSTVTVQTNMFVDGAIQTGAGVQFPMTSANLLITARGADLQHLWLTNTRLLLLNGSPITTMNDVQFLGMDPTGIQFEVQRSGAAGVGDFAATMTAPIFNTAPTSGVYMKVTDTDALAPFVTVNVSTGTPASPGGFASVIGSAVINWASTITLVTSGNWSTAGNWLPAVVPDSFADVVIPTGKTATLSVPSFAKNLTIQGSGLIAQGAFDLEVHGSLATDTTQGGITCTTGITYQPDGPPATLMGRLCRYHSGAKITQIGLVTVDSVFHVHDSTYTFNGHKVTTKEAWVATLAGSTGALVMTNPADSLIVSDSLWVGDPASISTSVSTLSAGIIALNGNFRQVGSPGTGYFSATGTHTTFMTGGAAAPKFINFTDSTASGFQNFTHNGNGIQIPGTGYAKVRGNLVMKSGAGFNGATGRLVVGGTLFGAPTSNVTTRNFELAGVYSDTGTFNPDTAVFSGGTVAVPQVIPDTLTLTTSGPSLKNVRVSGIATMVPNSAQFNWLINGNLIVSGNGSLQIGTGNTITVSVSGTFSTVNNGVLVMNSANSALNVTGNVSFGGGSTTGLLTNGALTLNGSFTQLGSTTSFAPSGSQTTTFGSGGSQSVTFANPVSSTFQNLSISGATTLSLQSDVVALGTLNHSGASAIGITSGATTRLLTVSGLNNAGPATLTLTNTQLKFVDGTTNGTFNNVTFTGFAASSPLTYFEVARTVGGPFTFTSLNFSGTLGAAGRYLVNSGSRSVTLVTVSPLTAVAASICGCVAFNANTGAGTLIWP